MPGILMAIPAIHLVSICTRSSFPDFSPAVAFPKRFQCRCMRPGSSASSSNQPLSSEQAVFEAIANFDANQNTLPIVRIFENDLARLTLVGAADFQQALTAAAADGGEAADEHISSGLDAMVVETLFPGPFDERSTVSTRLFLPARKVKEKAIKLKKSMAKDVFEGTMSKTILAMTFRQVVLQQLWSLEVALFRIGSERNMDDLESTREVPVMLNHSSTDGRVISVLAEVLCAAALESTEKHFFPDSMSTASNWPFSLFNKRKCISSSDYSIVLHNLLEHEVIANARMLLEKFNLQRGKIKHSGGKLKSSWWTSPAFLKLEKIGGPEFCTWVSEWVPSYKIEIDADNFNDVKFEGWKKLEANRWELILTHSQMVSLAAILDMYYEDSFTLPNKRLSCYAVAKSSNSFLHKIKASSVLKVFSSIIVSGIFLVTVSVLREICLPHLPVRKNYIEKNSPTLSSDISCIPLQSVDQFELEACCISIIQRIKDFYSWPGEIRTKSGACAWIGELPVFLRDVEDKNSRRDDISSQSVIDEAKKSLEDIASYQVVISTDGGWKIVGFQPTNRVAVNNWASNPLARELYGGKDLSPGLIEPQLKMISCPSGTVVLELLMASTNPSSFFALVRPSEH